MRAFIERIELFPEKQPDGNWIRKIIFNFPVPVNGTEVKELPLENETMVEMVDYASAVDCGTVVNANLARVQTEGGIVQGIGMALTEQVQYTDKGMMMNNSLMQYKIPTRLDAGRIRVEFEPSCEPAGPFGAKSIGELVINTPAPAITNAIYNATGLQFRSLPVTSEQIAMGLMQKRG